MSCPRCGTALRKRPRARMIITGALFLAAAILLLLFVHVAVVVVGAVLMAVVGISSLQGARRANVPRCPACGYRRS